MDRRHFLISAAAASQAWAGANDRVRIGIVGTGSRGSAHIREILPGKNVEIAALVDPDGRRTEQAGSFVYKMAGNRPKLESDMRRIFDDRVYDDGSTIVGQLRGVYTAEPMSWDFFGSNGHMHISADGRFRILMGRNKELQPEIAEYPENLDQFAGFADAIRADDAKLLHSEIEETAISTALCHLGNIAYRTGRDLRFNQTSMQFTGDSEANKLLTRDYRKPYVVADNV